MVKLNKSGQAGNGAAILLIVITVLIVLYILFLPPAERYNLLSNNTGTSTTTSSTGQILMKESPGKLDYISDDQREYDLSSFTISTQVKGEVLTTRSSLYTKNSAFDKKEESIQFTARSGLTDNILLSFNIEKASGRLHITLNGETILDSELQEGNSPPISIDAEKVQDSNELRFSVSSPGVAFWRYNEYSLKDIKITADVTDRSQSESTQPLMLTEEDLTYLKSAKLRYAPVCTLGEVSNLEVSINGLSLFKGTPDCGMYVYSPIANNILFEGENKIVFSVDRGTVLIDGLRITNTYEIDNNPIYYFEMEDANFTNPEDPDDYSLKTNYDVFMDLTFPNTDQKRFEVFINGKKMGFNTAKRLETRQIDNYVRPGTNSVEIIPLQDMTLTEIKLRLKKI